MDFVYLRCFDIKWPDTEDAQHFISMAATTSKSLDPKREYDITEKVVSSGLARSIEEQYGELFLSSHNASSEFQYIVRLSSKGHCTLWMRREGEKKNALYLKVDTSVGALVNEEPGDVHVLLLKSKQKSVIEHAVRCILAARHSS